MTHPAIVDTMSNAALDTGLSSNSLAGGGYDGTLRSAEGNVCGFHGGRGQQTEGHSI